MKNSLRALTLALCLPLSSGCGSETAAPAPESDCSSLSTILTRAPGVQYSEGEEIHQSWLLADDPALWLPAKGDFPALAEYRTRVRKTLPDVSPLGLIRTNRDRNPWLERDHPAERTINRLVEEGLGIHRPMNCLESQVLEFQAARFPLYEQPTEIIALVLRRAEEVKVYIAADDDAIPPKPKWAIAEIEDAVEGGWRFFGVFHNHTFSHAEERGLLPVAAPSASDVQLSAAFVEGLGLERIWVADGFSTLELTAEEIRELARMLEEAVG